MPLNKEQMREYQRKRRCGNTNADKRYNNKIVLARNELKRQAVAYKGGKCQICGNEYDQVCYDFHHLDPTQKDVNIANLLFGNRLELMIPELDKCILVCSNCHRVIHKQSATHNGKQRAREQLSIL